MIEINLKKGRKSVTLPVVMGLDLNKINPIFLIIAWVIYVSSINFTKSYFEDGNQKIEVEINGMQAQYRRLKAKERDLLGVKQEIQRMKAQEDKLKEILKVVNAILKIKKNPKTFLLYIAKNIPNDLWLEEMNINKDELSIVGYSKSYKSIGLFMDLMSESIFFEGKPRLIESKTMTDKLTGVRNEKFKIVGKIDRYD